MSDEIPGMVNGVCATLPSSTTAYRAVSGDASAYPLILRDMAGRTAIAVLGLYFGAGLRGEQLFRAAISTGVSIEVFALVYAWLQFNQAPARR